MADKKEPKKLLRVTSLGLEKDVYGDKCVHPRFAMMSAPPERKQCFKFQQCRDFVHEYVGSAIKSETYPGNGRVFASKVDFSKLRLLIQRGENAKDQSFIDFKENLFSAKRVLNHYEVIAGWQPSVITTVKHDQFKHVWLLTGPGQWMSHPCLISAVTLIIRFVGANGPIDFKDQKELDIKIKNLCENKDNKDVFIMRNVFEKLPNILKNYSKIFDRGSIKKAFTMTSDTCSHGGGGIQALCEYESIDEKANAVVKEMFDCR